jgi:adenylate kinase
MKLVLFGKPGAGKGTQALALSKIMDLPCVSMGQCLRDASGRSDMDGALAQKLIATGALAPPSYLLRILGPRFQQDCILEGFPRNLEQLDVLRASYGCPPAVLLDVSDDVVLDRLLRRKVCSVCGSTPDDQGVPACRCAGNLVQRSDDTPSLILERLHVYNTQTAPMIAAYDRAALHVIDGSQTPSRVTDAILRVFREQYLFKTQLSRT